MVDSCDLHLVSLIISLTLVIYGRADIQREDEHDEEAQEPGEEGGEQDHPILLAKISISVQQEEREEEHHHHLQRERHAAHPDINPSDGHQTLHQHLPSSNRHDV